MQDKKIDVSKINLIGNYKRRRSTKVHKDDYKRLPLKLSSSTLLNAYTLHFLDKAEEPVFGKEILNKIISSSDDPQMWHPSHGTLYPILNKLLKEGYIALTQVAGSKRKYYEITELGREALNVELQSLEGSVKRSEKFFNNIYRELYK